MTITEEVIVEGEQLLMRLSSGIMRMANQKHLFVELPGQKFNHLYFGRRKGKAAWKIGISDDPIKRAQSINVVLRNTNHEPDFELIRFIRGPHDIVTAHEDAIKKQFKADLVMGKEWFGVDIEPAYQAAAQEIAFVWDRRLAQWTPDQAVQAAYRAEKLFALFSPITLETRHSMLLAELEEWRKRGQEVLEHPGNPDDLPF